MKELDKNDALIENTPPFVAVSVKETQKQSDMYLKCNECNFETPSDCVLDWHLSKVHGWSNDKISDFWIQALIQGTVKNVIMKQRTNMILMLIHGQNMKKKRMKQ